MSQEKYNAMSIGRNVNTFVVVEGEASAEWNVHDKGIANVTVRSVLSYNGTYYYPKNAPDLGTDSVYCSDDEKDTWICYDFGECDPNWLLSEGVWRWSWRL